MLRLGEGGDGGGGFDFEPPHYILQPDKTLLDVDMLTHGLWIEEQWRLVGLGRPNLVQVGWTNVTGGYLSTVFLPLDVSLFRDGPPTLFETMWFDGEEANVLRRYGTWAEAEVGHRATLRAMRRYLPRMERARLAGDKRGMRRCEFFIRYAAWSSR